MPATITISEHGRDGQVTYTEGLSRTIRGYWEFGGQDVVVILNMGSRKDWERAHAWVGDRRGEILRTIADEVIRQRAPTCAAEIDLDQGRILLRQDGTAGKVAQAAGVTPDQKARAFYQRHRDLRLKLALGGGVIAVVVAAVFGLGRQVILVQPSSGTPLNEAVRTKAHIASLIQTTDAHLPEITGRGGKTTTSLSIVLIPLDGSKAMLVPIVEGVTGSGHSLARIMGSDGYTLWFDAAGLHGVRLKDYELITPKDLAKANPQVGAEWWDDPRGMDIIGGRLHIVNADRSAAFEVDPGSWKAVPVQPKVGPARSLRISITDHLVSGFSPEPGQWFGVHANEELASDIRPGKWVRQVERAEDRKRQRRICSGSTEPASDGTHQRIVELAPVDSASYFNAAFIATPDGSSAQRLAGPESYLLMFTSAPGLAGTVVLARVDRQGSVIWQTDTGLDRFSLEQLLPGDGATAFVGTRPAVPDKLNEPLVVLVDHETGALTSHSLWR